MQQMSAVQPWTETTSPDDLTPPSAPTRPPRATEQNDSNPARMLVIALALSTVAWSLLVVLVLTTLAS